MQKSETIGELAKALVSVQGKLEGAKKDQQNPFFKSSYADLTSVWNACRELLVENELAVVQTSSVIEGKELVLDTTLVHTSGEWISGQLSVPLAKNDPQGLGSAMTYARRYGLSAIIGICPEDDDAEGAVQHKATTKEPVKKPVKPPKPEQTLSLDEKSLLESLKKLGELAPKEWSNKQIVLLFRNLQADIKGTSITEMFSNLTEENKVWLVKMVSEALDAFEKQADK